MHYLMKTNLFWFKFQWIGSPIQTPCQLVKFVQKWNKINSRKCIWKCYVQNVCLNVLFWYGKVIFKLISRRDILNISSEIVLRWRPQNLTNEKSTLVQLMAWSCQATSHYLSQSWPRSISPYGVTRPQCVIVALLRNLSIPHRFMSTATNLKLRIPCVVSCTVPVQCSPSGWCSSDGCHRWTAASVKVRESLVSNRQQAIKWINDDLSYFLRTVQCCYKVVNFHPNPHKRGQDMGCLFRI